MYCRGAPRARQAAAPTVKVVAKSAARKSSAKATAVAGHRHASLLAGEGCEVLVQEVFKHVHTVHQQLNEPTPVDPRFNEASS